MLRKGWVSLEAFGPLGKERAAAFPRELQRRNISAFLSRERRRQATCLSRHPQAMGKASWGTLACLMLWPHLFLLSAREQTDAARRVQCLNNYSFQGRRVACQWRHDRALGGTLFYLNFSDTLGLSSDLICHLSASPGSPDRFNCSASSEEGEFTENDEYRVVLHASSSGGDHTDTIFATYNPRLHIECDPPFDLRSECGASKCRVYWKRPKACEIWEAWQWELAFKAAQEPWEQAQRKVFISSETWVDVEGFEFKRGRDHVARIRCKTPDENPHYGSQWSPWSPSVTLAAQPGDQRQLDAPLYSLLCLGALLLLLALALCRRARRSSSCGGRIPTPATFFQPLYHTHRGDFKGWTGLAPEQDSTATGRRSGDEEAAVSRLSVLQSPPGAGHGPAKQCASQRGGGTQSEELWLALQEPERPPGDYCTLGGAGEGAAPMSAARPPPPARPASGAPISSHPLRSRAQERPEGQPGIPAALGRQARNCTRSGGSSEAWPTMGHYSF